MARARDILLVAFIALLASVFFFLANLFYFYQGHYPFYKYWGLTCFFLSYLGMLSLLLVLLQQLFTKLREKAWWQKGGLVFISALLVLSGHIFSLNSLETAQGKKFFENRFFQCLPHAPWAFKSSVGQLGAREFFKTTPIVLQYYWYTFEDICRMENLRLSFKAFDEKLPSHCADKEKYYCLVNTLEHITAKAPLGIAGVVLAQDLLLEFREVDIAGQARNPQAQNSREEVLKRTGATLPVHGKNFNQC